MEGEMKSLAIDTAPPELKEDGEIEEFDSEDDEITDDDDLSGESEDDAVATINKIRREHLARQQAMARRGRPSGPRSRLLTMSQKRKLEAVKTFQNFTKKLKQDTGITIRSLKGGDVLDLDDLFCSESEEYSDTSDGLSEPEFEVNPSAALELNHGDESFIDPFTGDFVEPKTQTKVEKRAEMAQINATTAQVDPIDSKNMLPPKTIDTKETELNNLLDSVVKDDNEPKQKSSTVSDVNNKPPESEKTKEVDKAMIPESSVDKDGEKKPPTSSSINIRRNIRDVMDEKQLDASTLAAQRQESERLARVQEQQRIIREVQRQIAINKQNKIQARNLALMQGSGASLLKKPGQKINLSNTVLVKLPSGEVKRTVLKPNHLDVMRLKSIASAQKQLVKSDAKPSEKKEVVEIVDSTSSGSSASEAESSSDSDDCIMLSDSEVPASPEVEEDPNNSGLHVNDAYNIPDEKGRVIINIGHPETEEDIFLAPQIARIIKPHQIGGVRFLYDNIIESTERFANSAGFGCILAHSMGLGKTLQIVSFTDIFLRHTPAKTVLCIMPINTLQNWVAEFNMWLPMDVATSPLTIYGDVRPREFPIYVLNDSHKTLQMRAKVVREWRSTGGVLMIGYELYRLLSLKKDKKPRRKRKADPPKAEQTKPKEGKEVNDDTQGSSDNTTASKPEDGKQLEAKQENGEVPQKASESVTTDSSKVECEVKKDEEPSVEEKKLLDEMFEALVKPGPDLVICDEGHRIKNSHSNISYALKQMRTKRRVVLTGYPLQNNLLEYWCMVDFVRPNYLGTKTEFCNMFERPIQNGQCIDSTPQDMRLMRYRAHVLHSLLVGFVQRRSHAVLQTTLPQKEEYVLLVRMTPLQRKLYETFMNELVRSKTVPNPLKAFAICCKIWNHPDVLYMFLKKRAESNLAVEMDLDLEEVVGSRLQRSMRKPTRARDKKGNIKKPAATIPPNTMNPNARNTSQQPQTNQPYNTQPNPYPGYENQWNYPPQNQNYDPNYPQQQYPYNAQQGASGYTPGYDQQNYWNQSGYYGNSGYYNQPNYQGQQTYPQPTQSGSDPNQQYPYVKQENYNQAPYPPNIQDPNAPAPPYYNQNQPFTSNSPTSYPTQPYNVSNQSFPNNPQPYPNSQPNPPNYPIPPSNPQSYPNPPQTYPPNAPTQPYSQSAPNSQPTQNFPQNSLPPPDNYAQNPIPPQENYTQQNYVPNQPPGSNNLGNNPPFPPNASHSFPPAQPLNPQQNIYNPSSTPNPIAYQQDPAQLTQPPYTSNPAVPQTSEQSQHQTAGPQQNFAYQQPQPGANPEAYNQQYGHQYQQNYPPYQEGSFQNRQDANGLPPPNSFQPNPTQPYQGYPQNGQPYGYNTNYPPFENNKQSPYQEVSNETIKSEPTESKLNIESENALTDNVSNCYPSAIPSYLNSPMETKSPSGSADIPISIVNAMKTESDKVKEEKTEIKSESDSEVKIEDLDTKKIVNSEVKKSETAEKSIDHKKEKSEDEASDCESRKKISKKESPKSKTAKPRARPGPKSKTRPVKARKQSKEKDGSESEESEKDEKKSKEEEAAAAKKNEEMTYDWAAELLKDYIPGLIENSAKMELFFMIVNESIVMGDRMLLFSQSLFTLNLIEDFLERNYIPGTNDYWQRNVTYFRLDGSTHALEREKLINEFNSNPKVHLFLVSTRAGSLGINLVGANRVIVFDASWNPCHDTQAVCRVYRYGQQKPCFVYRFVMDCCLEKKIYDRQINKQGMADRIVDECNPDAVLSMKEITSLCWDADEKEPEAKDLSESRDKYSDDIMQSIVTNHWKMLSREPFKHESLLVDRKEKKLSSAEKRLAQRGYELEKKAAAAPKPLVGRARPVGTVRPMQHAARWIPADVWRRQGMTAQEMTLPLDVVIPTNSAEKANIVLKAGQRVMVLKSPKGIYMQLESGKIIAIKTSFKVGQKPGEKESNSPVGKKVIGIRPPTATLPGSLKNNSAITVTPKNIVRPGLQRIIPRAGMQGRINVRPVFNKGLRPMFHGQNRMQTIIRNKFPLGPRVIRPNLIMRNKGISDDSKIGAETHILDSEDEEKHTRKENEDSHELSEVPETSSDSNHKSVNEENESTAVHKDKIPAPVSLLTDETFPSETVLSTGRPNSSKIFHQSTERKEQTDEAIERMHPINAPQPALVEREPTDLESTSTEVHHSIDEIPSKRSSLLTSLKSYRHHKSLFSKPASDNELSRLEKTVEAGSSAFRRGLDGITAEEPPERPGPKSRKKRLTATQTASVPPLPQSSTHYQHGPMEPNYSRGYEKSGIPRSQDSSLGATSNEEIPPLPVNPAGPLVNPALGPYNHMVPPYCIPPGKPLSPSLTAPVGNIPPPGFNQGAPHSFQPNPPYGGFGGLRQPFPPYYLNNQGYPPNAYPPNQPTKYPPDPQFTAPPESSNAQW